MPTRNVNLTAEQDAFIEQAVRSGRYQNASEAMRDALRRLQHHLQAEELELERLRLAIRAGVEALDNGAYSEVEDAALDDFLDELVVPATG